MNSFYTLQSCIKNNDLKNAKEQSHLFQFLTDKNKNIILDLIFKKRNYDLIYHICENEYYDPKKNDIIFRIMELNDENLLISFKNYFNDFNFYCLLWDKYKNIKLFDNLKINIKFSNYIIENEILELFNYFLFNHDFNIQVLNCLNEYIKNKNINKILYILNNLPKDFQFLYNNELTKNALIFNNLEILIKIINHLNTAEIFNYIKIETLIYFLKNKLLENIDIVTKKLFESYPVDILKLALENEYILFSNLEFYLRYSYLGHDFNEKFELILKYGYVVQEIDVVYMINKDLSSIKILIKNFKPKTLPFSKSNHKFIFNNLLNYDVFELFMDMYFIDPDITVELAYSDVLKFYIRYLKSKLSLKYEI